MSPYEASVPQFIKMLKNLEVWIDRAVAHATAKSFDPAVFLAARLAPDQYTFTRQVQSACDAAKFGGAYLSGKQAPSHPDTEQTLDELRERIKKVVTFLEGLNPADFDGAETRPVTLRFLPGKVISGADYLNEMSLPNFYFHITTAYSILRANGVDLGKTVFIGSLKVRDA